MKNLKYALPFLLIYLFTFIPLFWPYQLFRLIPYFIMFQLMTKAISKTQINNVTASVVFWLGVFFDVAPVFSAIPFITTTLIMVCFFMILFSEKNEQCDLLHKVKPIDFPS